MARTRDDDDERSHWSNRPSRFFRSRDRSPASNSRSDCYRPNRRTSNRVRSRSRSRDRSRDTYRLSERSLEREQRQDPSSRSRSPHRDSRNSYRSSVHYTSRSQRQNSPHGSRSPHRDSRKCSLNRRRSRSPARSEWHEFRARTPSPPFRSRSHQGTEEAKVRIAKQSKLVASEATVQANKWCFACHGIDHWTAQCSPDLMKDGWKCPSFELESFATEVSAHVQNETISSTEHLINHIYHATARLNFYEAYVEKRDALFMKLIKNSAFDKRIGDQHHELARVDGVTPYEAFLARSCRLTRAYAKSCASALRYWYTKDVLSNVSLEIVLDNPNADYTFGEKCEGVKLLLKDHYTRLTDDIAADRRVVPVDFSSCKDHRDFYLRLLKEAGDKYAKSMDEARCEWESLDNSFRLWKNEPSASKKQTLASLPSDTLRVSADLADQFSIPTIAFLKVESFRSYFPKQRNVANVANVARSNSTSAEGGKME